MGSTPRGISASRGSAVLGLGEYEGQTPFTVWQLICEERRPGFNAERGYVSPPPVDNAAVRWGSAFEDAIVDLASAKQGKQIVERERLFKLNCLDFVDKTFPEITCHIDGWYTNGSDLGAGQPLHEGKTTSMMNFWNNWGTPGTDRIPQGYQVQVQHQMLCTGASEAIVSVLVFPRRVDEWEAEGWCILETGSLGNPKLGYSQDPLTWARVLAEMGLFHQYPVAASPSLQRTLVDAYSHFWHTYVLPEREPPIDAYADIRRAFPAPVGTIVAGEQEERWAREYREIGEEIGDSGRLAKRRAELKVLLLKRMREMDKQMDDESREKSVLRDRTGKKLVQWDGKVFR